MLYSITLNFYYKNKLIYITFNSIYNAIRNYFKGPEYKRRVLIKQNAITFTIVIIKSEGKFIEDCLQLLLNNHCHLQYSLNANLHNDDFLYNKLIVTYQDIVAYQAAYFNPLTTLTSLIYSLQSSIITYRKINSTIK